MRFIAKRVGTAPNWGVWDTEKEEFVVHGYARGDAEWIAGEMSQDIERRGGAS